jgi:putative ABC transport system ATP-binding protein
MIKPDRFILIWMENLYIQNKVVSSGANIVHDLNLRIDSSEFVCISGLYGTDKISFINTLSCLNRPDQGKYLYNYNDTATIDKSELDSLRSEIGFIFKSLNIIGDLTVYQNIEIPVRFSSIVEKPREIAKAAERLGLSELLHTKVKKLTDMEKHKVSLARALAVSPMLIIADEPADDLGLEDAEALFSILKEINNQGTAIICFSERQQIIEKVQRHIIFEKGNIKSDSRNVCVCNEEEVV